MSSLITLAQAHGIHRYTGYYELQPLDGLPIVDVVIPFYSGDSHFLVEAVNCIQQQRFVRPIIHCIADGCDFPQLEVPCHRYCTEGGWGPYKITNSLVKYGHCQSEFMAIQDVDDVSLPDRLWKQLSTMKKWGYQMVGGSMYQQAAEGYTERRHLDFPVLRPRQTYSKLEDGILLNGTRTMLVETFRSLNGFLNLVCGSDKALCRRIACLPPHESIPCFGAFDIDAIRRLHPNSLTNGPNYGMESQLRQQTLLDIEESVSIMKADPSLDTARSIGNLDVTPPLTKISSPDVFDVDESTVHALKIEGENLISVNPLNDHTENLGQVLFLDK